MNYDINDGLNISFTSSDVHLWNKKFFENILASLKKLNVEMPNERSFSEFLLEIEQSYRTFLRKINDLPMIMKCRVKGDDSSHFGGQECADFARSIRDSAEKYLQSTNFKNRKNDNINNNDTSDNIYNFILNIRNLARSDEKYAKNVETKVYNDYLSLGKDYTLFELKKAGYSFDNDESN